jgi:hypothetical protein
MRIKVGDFGLATRLNHPDERRKTICGTPNYIAPEILEGKNGHSFEVDIWSTGVIMYTMLIGKPPFEAKDVKSTYKRIVSNQFSFPDHTPIDEHAKILIKKFLQSNPLERPKLIDIGRYRFFVSENAYIPSTLPESSLKEVPKMHEKAAKAIINDNIDADEGIANDENENYNVKATNIKQISTVKNNDINEVVNNMKKIKSKNSNNENILRVSNSSTTDNDTINNVNTINNNNNNTLLEKKMSKLSISKSNEYLPNTQQSVLSERSPQSDSARCNKINIDPCESQQRNTANVFTFNKNLMQQSQSRNTNAHTIEEEVVVNANKITMKTINNYLDEDSSSKKSCTTTDKGTTQSEAKEAKKFVEHEEVNEDMKQEVLSNHENYQSPSLCQHHSSIGKNGGEKMCLDTIESMHKILYRSKINSTSTTKPNRKSDDQVVDGCENEDLILPNVWVVRYVDYTSKYGLGFLLNTGSAGVYFNDTTKIVLSEDGTTFQYIERKRKNEQIISNDHNHQMYDMNNYPVELQKKVTLLRHFRNYLLDQHRIQKDGEEKSLESQQNIVQNFNIQESDHFSMNDVVETNKSSSTKDSKSNLIFLKKWVRTRHAILFRLSNRTVQVVFFDRSEIILSSEARVVTYVNKQGKREGYPLENILNSGRSDIAKRLKYTKDIMGRLISATK